MCGKYIFSLPYETEKYIIILYISHFKGPSGDPGYEGFLIGTKGEAGDRGNIIDINVIFQRY